MNSEYLNQIIRLIEGELGLKPHFIRLSLWEEMIEERMHLLHLLTYEDYLKHLHLSSAELQKLVERMVIPETWFFRDQEVFHFLSQWLKQTKIPTSFFKALSLACSTGEEPYSIAITFFEAGYSRNAFSIDAIDINQEALVKARLGIYQKHSFRNKDLSYLDHYFNKTNGNYAIKQQVKEQVHFYYGNILDNKTFIYSSFYHLIFCRNLLIYLTKEAQIRLLNQIKRLLAPQGIVIVGSAETQIASHADFVPVEFPNAYAFKLKFQPPATQIFHSFNQDSSIVQPPLTSPPSATHSLLQSSSKENDKNLLLQKAMKLADVGLFADSMQICFNFINQYGAHPEVYYLLGLINQTMENEEKAEDFFQKAVYLKPTYYEALICLALLYEKKGDKNKAEIFRQRAQKSL